MAEHPAPGAVHENAIPLNGSAPAPHSADAPSPDAPVHRSEYRPTIRELPSAERPRERLRSYGEGALSTAELLAIILRVGMAGENVLEVASRLLSQHGGLVGLGRLSFDELCATRGLGEAKAAQLRAALELGRRLAVSTPEERPVIREPKDVAQLVQPEMQLLDQEQLRVLVLNTKNQVLAIPTISSGTVNQSQVRPAEVFRPAIRANAPSIIVVHNHPSGDPAPSKEDVSVTRDLVNAGRLLDVEVLDHIVIGHGRFVSLKDRGLGF
ncbi:MAG TPA: DNA repair protein RadC [Dehalococcoidia bacterium]